MDRQHSLIKSLEERTCSQRRIHSKPSRRHLFKEMGLVLVVLVKVELDQLGQLVQEVLAMVKVELEFIFQVLI